MNITNFFNEPPLLEPIRLEPIISIPKPVVKPVVKPFLIKSKTVTISQLEAHTQDRILYRQKLEKERKKRTIYYWARREEYLEYAKRLIDKLASIKMKERSPYERNIINKTRKQFKSVQNKGKFWEIYLDDWVDDMENDADVKNQIRKYISFQDLKVNNVWIRKYG